MTFDLSNLPPDAAKFLGHAVSSGTFASPGEVIVAGLRLLEAREGSLAELRKFIDEGDADFAAGDYLEITNPAEHRALFDRLKAELPRADSLPLPRP
jgi:putative addiction module CopG family antidote